MPHPSDYLAAFDKPPFLFAVTGARALPGPPLVALMTELDGTESANKSVLSRMVDWGHLAVERSGRVGVYRLGGTLREDYEAIAARRRPDPWDGRLHALLLDPDGVDSVERERFRSSALRHGYRFLQPGLLIGARDTSAPLVGWVRDLGATAFWMDADAARLRALVARAWQLEDLGQRYTEAVAHGRRVVADADGSPGPDALRLLHRATRPVTELAVRTRGLPAELLPDDWPLAELRDFLDDAYTRLGPDASAYARAVVADSPHATLARWRPERVLG